MSGFTKLFSSIVTSSLWVENDATLRAWIAMLATCDAKGVVEGSIPGFANLARISIADMESALLTLTSPDKYSRTPDFDGRRIEAIPGGWRILNYDVYRERAQVGEGSRAPYHRAYRRRKKEAEHKPVAQQSRDENATESVARGQEERREKREVIQKKEEPLAGPAPQTEILPDVYWDNESETININEDWLRAELEDYQAAAGVFLSRTDYQAELEQLRLEFLRDTRLRAVLRKRSNGKPSSEAKFRAMASYVVGRFKAAIQRKTRYGKAGPRSKVEESLAGVRAFAARTDEDGS